MHYDHHPSSTGGAMVNTISSSTGNMLATLATSALASSSEEMKSAIGFITNSITGNSESSNTLMLGNTADSSSANAAALQQTVVNSEFLSPTAITLLVFGVLGTAATCLIYCNRSYLASKFGLMKYERTSSEEDQDTAAVELGDLGSSNSDTEDENEKFKI